MKKTTIQSSAPSAPPREFTAARHHATEAMRLGSAAAQHAILCGIELIRIRAAQGISQGTRTDLRRTSRDGIGKLSWPELVRREVGISDDCARQWMQAARNQIPVLAEQLQLESGPAVIEAVVEVIDQPATIAAVAEITQGKTLEQLLLPLDAAGSLDIAKLPPKKRERYDALSEAALDGDKKAAALCRQIEAGTLDPGRAYAGWKGDSTRKAQGKTGRADVNHATNLHAALKKLVTSLQYFHGLDPDDQAALTRFWRENHLGAHLPPSWTIIPQ